MRTLARWLVKAENPVLFTDRVRCRERHSEEVIRSSQN